MRSTVQSMLLSLSLLTAMPMVASAHSLKSGLGGHAGYHGKGHFSGFWGGAPSSGGSSSGGSSVPELDPSAASAALALLAGGAAVIAGRRRKQST
jgi:hypothetical protein